MVLIPFQRGAVALRGPDQRCVGEQGTLGFSGSARGVHDHRRGITAAAQQQRRVQAGIGSDALVGAWRLFGTLVDQDQTWSVSYQLPDGGCERVLEQQRCRFAVGQDVAQLGRLKAPVEYH
ncbi:hypothetical protein D9M71_446300 [compost metagenome]